MIDICIANDVLIVSDEIHGDIVYEKTHYNLGALEKIHKHCVILNAPSKTFNVAGLNTSYAIIPDDRLRRRFHVKQDKSGITNGNPFGIEALIAAYEEGDVWLDALKRYLADNISFIKDFIVKHKLPISPIPVEATFLVWLDCSKMGLDHEALVDFFIHHAKLGLNDGKSFGKTGEGYMRLNIGTSREVLEEAMQRLLQAYREIK
jgi:cystathionine beta-lyase